VGARRLLSGGRPALPGWTATEEIFARVARYAAHADVRTLRFLMTERGTPYAGLRAKLVNTEAFHAVWLGDFDASEPDLQVLLYLHGASRAPPRTACHAG